MELFDFTNDLHKFFTVRIIEASSLNNIKCGLDCFWFFAACILGDAFALLKEETLVEQVMKDILS